MTIDPSFLIPTWPAANNLAASLLPPLLGDSPYALRAGVAYSRLGSAIPSTDTVLTTWPGFPPNNLEDDGVAELAFLASTDIAFPTPAAVTGSPAYVNFLFTRLQGVAAGWSPQGIAAPIASSILCVSPWCFVNEQGLYWGGLGGGGVLLTENQRARVPWAQLALDSSAGSTGDLVDALAAVLLVPSARTIAPGATFTFAMVATYV